MFMGLRETIAHFEQRVDRRFEQVDARFLGIEGRLLALDQKVDQRFGALDQKVGDLHRKSDVRFKWIAGLLGACLTSIIVCLVGIILTGVTP